MSNLTQVWEIIKDAVSNFGLLRGIFLLFFWIAHFWIYRLYQGRLKDRQKQIDQIAAENREYRERFLTLLDRHFDLVSKPGEKGNGKGLVETKLEGDKAPQLTTEGDRQKLPPKPQRKKSPRTPGRE